MVTIRYSLTAKDLAEIEAERRGGFPRKVLRILFGAVAGFMGFILIWQAVFFFSWQRPFANLTFIGLGLLLLWCGFEVPGLNRILRQLSDPYAEREVHVYEGKVVTYCKGKSWEFRWFPRRGFKETGKFFVLSALRSDGAVRIPKRVVTPEQERNLREFVENETEAEIPVECCFQLTQEDVNERDAACHPWLNSRGGKIASRAGLATLAIVLPAVFWMMRNGSKPDFQQLSREPLIIAGFVAYELLLFWGATGYIGKQSLYGLNRERRVCLTISRSQPLAGRRRKCADGNTFFVIWRPPTFLSYELG